MTKSIKLKNDIYIDSSGICIDRQNLEEFIKAKGKTLAVGLTAPFSVPSVTQVMIPWNLVKYTNANDNDFKLESGKIYITSDYIKTVTVYAQISQQPFYDAWYIYLFKNGVQLTANVSVNNFSKTTFTIPVQKGDYIEARCYCAGGNGGSVDSWADASYMQVTAI